MRKKGIILKVFVFFFFFCHSSLLNAEEKGTLSIECKPKLCQIFLDHKNLGITPYKITLPQGKYLLQLKKEGFDNYQKTIEIIGGTKGTLTCSLRELGKIAVKSEPKGAKVFLDGKYLGLSPTIMEKLQKGNYHISLKKEGYQLYEKTMGTGPGRSDQLNIKLAPVNPEMRVEVPEGVFEMGYGGGLPNERPVKRISLDTFAIDKFEVTNGRYRKCVEAGKCNPPRETKYYRLARYMNHPVVFVRWEDAKEFCRWEGKRLPTEAEWEKAARGQKGALFPWGKESGDFSVRANLKGKGDGAAKLAHIGNFDKGASPYGVQDMVGNAREWVFDEYAPDFYEKIPFKNPVRKKKGLFFGKSEARVVRGSSWQEDKKESRVTKRESMPPHSFNEFTGFRCLLGNPL